MLKWTISRRARGVVGLQQATQIDSGMTWNCQPKKVIVLYTKSKWALGCS